MKGFQTGMEVKLIVVATTRNWITTTKLLKAKKAGMSTYN
jgi:hypothetical protein